ncbi:Multidrug efflux pump subunit AcrB like [Melia azedarach]|uniref:Multidrug efflux pump subunit AcrB like n=1 Tax=Melia azedarach TaxID=155640 RepID=A0ACC1YIN4_MELAZ|nr:Multidrug efflux pump subunit AcrB like [Melia azedarach]
METLLLHCCHHYYFPRKLFSTTFDHSTVFNKTKIHYCPERSNRRHSILPCITSNGSRLLTRKAATPAGGVPLPPLDLTEDNVRQVIDDARVELAQLFDTSVGITGVAELADLDGPFVKIRLRGRFWHKRSTVVARLANYLKQRIPEILEVDIEDEKQLDDSPDNF